ncbi:MAG TPA: DNA polymerase/3'-5' exonuclease PolX [Candidatus Thermoplasmatota archaeon]|nr:DNA polymerase/3'-5' exonuclease PolX [Candidatus Thermoplasmatota archaeon]
MRNKEIARIFNEIADMYEMQDIDFKPRAYRKAAQNIESLGKDIEEIYEDDELKNIPGIGESTAEEIKEYLDTGKVQRLEKLKTDMPVDLRSLSAVETIGPKKIKVLYQQLGVSNLDDLEQAAKQGKIQDLEGFGKKTEENILANISFAREKGQRFLLGYVLPEAKEIIQELTDQVDQIELAGSLRRMKETVGDVDILVVSSESEKVMDYFTNLDRVEQVIAHGKTKSTIRLYGGIQVDLRIVNKQSFGSALQYFTGSKDHNVKLRKIAQKNGLKLNEYGLFEDDKRKAGESEEKVYQKLDLEWVPPELREDIGEIDAAKQNSLPNLIQYDDVNGDLQMHSNWSDGSNTMKEMIEESRNLGHSFIAFTDHVGTLKVAGGMDKKEWEKQGEKIAEFQKKFDDIHIFHGLEANIKKNGDLDIDSSFLKEADVVLASVHSSFRLPKKEMTKRIIKAIENKYVHILSHPTGRKIQKKEAINLDLDAVFKAARKNDVAIEINAYPERLDLNDVHVHRAINKNVKLSIGTDAHRKDHLRYYSLGTAVARRGWAQKKDIINAFSLSKLKNFLNKTQ